jgi:hypothetical protein
LQLGDVIITAELRRLMVVRLPTSPDDLPEVLPPADTWVYWVESGEALASRPQPLGPAPSAPITARGGQWVRRRHLRLHDVIIHADGVRARVAALPDDVDTLPTLERVPSEEELAAARQPFVIRATDGHPWYVKDKGWTATKDLRPGDCLLTDTGSTICITEVSDNGDVEPVFNLHVQGAHTYFVGALSDGSAVLVHNESPAANTANRENILKNAAKDLDRRVERGELTKDERDLRYEVVKAGLAHQMKFDSGQPPNPDYFAVSTEKDSNGKDVEVYRFKENAGVEGTHDRVYGGDPYSNTGCTRATQTLMLEGEAQLAVKKGKAHDFNKAVEGKTMDELYPDEEDTEHQKVEFDDKGLNTKTFIPGDRVWMQNHRFTSIDENTGIGDPEGNEGSNVIYLGQSTSGEQLFVHVDGNKIDTLPELRRNVRAYSASDRADPNVLNYKFKARYTPEVPPLLK